MLEPPTKGDERRPGVMNPVNVPIQVTISPVGAVLQEDIVVTVTVVGGTATGKINDKLDYACWSCEKGNYRVSLLPHRDNKLLYCHMISQTKYMSWCISFHPFSG